MYPANDLQSGAALLNLVGSFWSSTAVDSDFFTAYGSALGRLYQQLFLNLNETFACRSRYTCPLSHHEEWSSFSLLASQKQRLTLSYDGLPARQVVAWPLPAALVDVSSLSDRLTQPGAILVRNIDYVVDTDLGLLVFAVDPYSSSFAQTPIFTNGLQTDTALTAWGFAAELEQEQVWTQFGYLTGVHLPSSPRYRDLVNVLLDGSIYGWAQQRLEGFFSALLDFPLTSADGEVVQQVATDRHGSVVITDKAVYRYGAAAAIIVTPGDILRAGQPMAAGLAIHDLGNGQVPFGLTSLDTGPGQLLGTYSGPLTWDLPEVPLQVTTVSGKTRVAWALGGNPTDVQTFWDTVHTNGIAAGQTLANLLDQRTDPVGEPQAGNLPATISPLVFLITNVLRNHTLVVTIDLSAAGPDALGLGYLWLLRRFVPPETLVLL